MNYILLTLFTYFKIYIIIHHNTASRPATVPLPTISIAEASEAEVDEGEATDCEPDLEADAETEDLGAVALADELPNAEADDEVIEEKDVIVEFPETMSVWDSEIMLSVTRLSGRVVVAVPLVAEPVVPEAVVPAEDTAAPFAMPK
jgi:hypothetical protein